MFRFPQRSRLTSALSVVLAIAAAFAAAAGLTDLAEARRSRPKRRKTPLKLIARLGANLGVNPSGRAAARVAAAGVERPTSEIVALQAGLALLTTLTALPLATLAPGRLPVALLLAAPLAGFLAPEYGLRRRARTRAHLRWKPSCLTCSISSGSPSPLASRRAAP